MVKCARLSLIIHTVAVTTIILCCTAAAVAYADTTGTAGNTPTTLSSIKIDRSGQVLSETPKNEPATTSTTNPRSSNGTARNSGNDDNGNVGNRANSTSTTGASSGATKKNGSGKTSGSSSIDNSNNSANIGASTNNTDPDGRADTSIGNSLKPGAENDDPGALDAADEGDNADEAVSDSSGGSDEKVVIKGAQVENPAAADNAKKDASEENPIGFDVKPYLAIAVLIMLIGTTIFAGKSPGPGGKKAMVNKQTRLS